MSGLIQVAIRELASSVTENSSPIGFELGRGSKARLVHESQTTSESAWLQEATRERKSDWARDLNSRGILTCAMAAAANEESVSGGRGEGPMLMID
ncbi:hypothetical protein Mp_6g06700 [Marchantia polymorpha subsp. ruderalis]|uniref:Uncharacterized protein n=2 Tax=Marchantia polymorpha TaxID=3197 RepID=A0AAF6BP89_MARPO|nr:hypothetical protein MARPO_0173s0015 [Marchantia polymorpha]BBN13823.1 hypothetical protein Mp_6g06700 [Marchantia polymorpha subsp. ruderalis]|eukprot:PTQ28112.1 hypothetical protein MARPO_0173s0015 [Marchantia polymorpha]